jgi:hypothetical protein
MSQLGSIEIISNPIEVIITNKTPININVETQSHSLDITTNAFQGQRGIDGKTAYEVAVENGYVGSESDWLASLRVGESTFVSKQIIITQDMINNKEILLEHQVANPDTVELSIYGGIEQRPTVDFLVEGNKITFFELALDSLIDVGTAIMVRYIKVL